MHKTEKISLVVLAAGMGSRYGGLKQMESIDALQQFWQAEAVFQNLLQSQQRAR